METRTLVPSADHPRAAYPAFDDAAEPKLTFYDVAEDSLPTESLAAALVCKSRYPIWLRLGPQDRDPGTFLVSLATAAARFGAANETLEVMRAKPGPVYGWPPLFAGLGAEMGGRLSNGGALVLENVHHAWDRTATFTLRDTSALLSLSAPGQLGATAYELSGGLRASSMSRPAKFPSQRGETLLGALWGLGYLWLRKTRSSVWAAMVAAVLVSRPQKVCAPWRASSI